MDKWRTILRRLLYPPKWVTVVVPPVAFAALAVVFVTGQTESALVYPLYAASAYALAVWVAAAYTGIRRLRSSALAQKLAISRYRADRQFRGGISLYQGMVANALYGAFRAVTGLCYASVWFGSMAVYYLVLGGLRAALVVGYRRRGMRGRAYEYRWYRRTAWLLFLLNIPMGGMIVMMVRTDAGFSYPGYVIYLSAMYTFYTMITAVVNLVIYRRVGSPILSAAKVLNLVSAMMSVLGLQTAMIAQFSNHDDAFRQQMNAITGGCVYAAVALLAVYMLKHSAAMRKRVASDEQIGEQVF